MASPASIFSCVAIINFLAHVSPIDAVVELSSAGKVVQAAEHCREAAGFWQNSKEKWPTGFKLDTSRRGARGRVPPRVGGEDVPRPRLCYLRVLVGYVAPA